MVSTRSVRYKFNEGERVLCYEPDPTKAKVLYDSKVLEVVENKDKRGRKTAEYLIHFQGWNSSWDRCVSEDFVLKDTTENRQLQRDLAEKSQLQLGAYLYRRERKKLTGSTHGPGPAKRLRHDFSDDGSSTSTQPDEAADTDSSSASANNSQPASPPPANNNPPAGRARIALPMSIRDRLTFDFHLVVKRGCLSRLPASPTIVEILESFVKWFARAGAWQEQQGRNDKPKKPNVHDGNRRLNLVREVADGIRIYFDFVLRGHLLYKQEINQYHELCGKFIGEQEEGRERRLVSSGVVVSPRPEGPRMPQHLLSPKLPEYSHLPPDPVADNDDDSNSEDEKEDNSMTTEEATSEVVAESVDKESAKNDSGAEDNATLAPAPRIGARRLRSHKSVVSQSENDEPAPSTSTGEPRTFETFSSSIGSSGSSMSEGWSNPTRAAPKRPKRKTRTPLSRLLNKVANWQMMPRAGTETVPSRVYGAIHLARLFVRMPDFLNMSQMPDMKLRLVVRHIEMFIQYLNEHGEWFGESYYVADNMSRST